MRIAPLLGSFLLKCLLFVAVALCVLNPNLKRAWLHLQHLSDPEKLIQPHLPELAVINEEIDGLVARYPFRKETELIEGYVYRLVPYATDYKTWGNIEYWPTAAEVLEKRQEDCDGRAILTASIMRSRGFASAKLVVGLNHMWIKVNENEKQAGAGARERSLLQPGADAKLELGGNSAIHYAKIVVSFLHPKSIRDNGSMLLLEMPPWRRTFLVLFAFFLAGYSWLTRRTTAALFAGTSASLALVQFTPLKAHPLTWQIALGFFAATLAGLLWLSLRASLRHPSLRTASDQVRV